MLYDVILSFAPRFFSAVTLHREKKRKSFHAADKYGTCAKEI